MSFRGDERAQTVQVGAILLLGIAVVALSVYQVTSVPAQNGDTEFTHNQQVHEQLQELRNSILDAAATGRSRSATVRLGTQYRNRIVAVNPGPPAGTLRTATLGGDSSIRIENATTNTESSGCWIGTDRELATKGLVYQPNYNEYRTAPTTIYENSVLYNRFEAGANTTIVNATGQRLVNGRDLSLVALGGSYSKSRSGTVSIDARPASQASRTINVTDSDGPLTLTVSTNLPAGVWGDLLDSELEANGGHVTDWSVAEGALTVQLEEGVTYDLSLDRVTIGSPSENEGLRCLGALDPRNGSVPENTTRNLKFNITDQYNAPLRNETVRFALSGPGTLSATGVRTDEQGRATVNYSAPTNVDRPTVPVRIRATSNRSVDLTKAGFDPRDRENAVVRLNVSNADGSLGSIRWNRSRIDSTEEAISCSASGCTYAPSDDTDGQFDVVAGAEPPQSVNVTFETNDSDVLSYTARDRESAPNGSARATLGEPNPGSATLTVSAGGDSAVLPVTVANRDPEADFRFAPTAPPTGEEVTFTANATDPDGPDGELQYTWEFGDGITGYGRQSEHSYNRSGSYTVTLTVTDDSGASATRTRQLSVENRPPTARFEHSPDSTALEPVRFDGSASTDPEGNLTYEWAFGDGTTATGPRPTHAYGTTGSYNVTLTVTDTNDTSRSTTRSVAVDGPAIGDTVAAINAGGSEYTATDGTVFAADQYYNGGGTSRSDGPISNTEDDPLYRTERTGAGASGLEYDVPVPETGTYTVRLHFAEIYSFEPGERVFSANLEGGATELSEYDIVADVGPRTATVKSYPIEVTDGTLNVAFDESADFAKLSAIEVIRGGGTNASIDADPARPYRTDEVSFDATGTVAPGQTPASYEWAFGDGEIASGPTPTHAYSDTGTYRVRLRTTAADGTVYTGQRTLTVRNRSPTAEIDRPNDPVAGREAQFDAAESEDPDGEITQYEWDFGDGTTGTGPRPPHTYNDPGEYNVTLTVTDSNGATATDTVTVSVAGGNPPTIERFDVDDDGDDIEIYGRSFDPDGDLSKVRFDLYGERTRETNRYTISGEEGERFRSDGTSEFTELPDGRYTVVMTLTDERGNTDRWERVVYIDN